MDIKKRKTMENTFEVTPRIKKWLEQARVRAKKPPPCQRFIHQLDAYNGRYAHYKPQERLARSLAWALINEPVCVFADEWIHGMFYDASDPQWSDSSGAFDSAVQAAASRIREEKPEFYKLATFENNEGVKDPSFLFDLHAYPGHIGWNGSHVLEYGFEALIQQCYTYADRTTDQKAIEFYNCVAIMMKAVLQWNQKHVQTLTRLAAAMKDRKDRDRINLCIRTMERVPAKPAASFLEALQSFYFQWLCVMYEVPYGGNSPGRLDQCLWPYLEKDLEKGNIDIQTAYEWIAALFIKMDERVHTTDGHVNTIVLGGVKADGTDGVNLLTMMMLDVFEKLDLTHPAVYTRIHPNHSKEYLKRCITYMQNGRNRAQILSDTAIMNAMTADGRMCYEDAAQYMCGGCMEIGAQGKHSDFMFSFRCNVPKLLELCITGGKCLVTKTQRIAPMRTLSEYDRFESFYHAFIRLASRYLRAQFECLDIASEETARCRPAFLQSALIDDCMKKGRNQHDGGARYHDYGGAVLGLPDTADCLYAIKQAVFDQRLVSAALLEKAMASDYEGYESIKHTMASLPKYGMGHTEADGMMIRLTNDFFDIYDSYRTRWNGKVIPTILTFTWAPQIGACLGARADGKRHGEPIAHGLTPQSGAMKEGLTAAMLSYASLPMKRMAGGASTMWDMDENDLDESLLTAVIQTFLDLGGQIFQGNMTSVDSLIHAMENPEQSEHIIVRVGGYSARFVHLDKMLQQEIINRYRHTSPNHG